MFNSKKDRSLTQYEINEVMGFVTNTINRALSTGQALDVMEKYDLVLVASINGEYIQGSVYQFSHCNIVNNESIELHETPLFAAERHYLNMEDFRDYLNEEHLETMDQTNIQAVLLMSGLIRSFKLQPN
ncbi:hypothetical protein [Mesobacillus selenatarsenatis]|uniref:Uncharacterized protein n=1 Tax=Mesobacillus selenatarsenatis TaxID=388741 RepID=A0A846TKZ2_9BACI|nr:hypothetical protein [Mesobacillus selenatarsenatis]NKE04725.1 hypothetical protein [Mesobacillus selenatarsenatis]